MVPPGTNVATEVQVSWGLGPALSASLSLPGGIGEGRTLGSLLKSSQESYIEGTRAYIFKKKVGLLWTSAPQNLKARAIATTLSVALGATQEAQIRPLGARRHLSTPSPACRVQPSSLG